MIYIILLLICVSPLSSNNEIEIRIRELVNQQIVDGCGCYLSVVKNGNLIFANDLTDTAWVNINGIDTKFVEYKSTQPSNDIKIGSKYSVYYKNEQYLLQIDYTITSICEKDDVECEFTGMDAILTVFSNKTKKSIKLTGGCGC